jgi:hypothetical protein
MDEMTRDDGYTPFAGRRQEPPTLTLVTRLWRAKKPQSVNVLSCSLYLHDASGGFEVRCGYGNEDHLLMSQVERTPEAAKARAGEWLAAALNRGFDVVA